MADERPTTIDSTPEEGARSPLVFVADPSAEAERFGDILRAAGYMVEDVDPAALVERIVSKRPRVVVLDIDREETRDRVIQLRKVPGTGAIDLVYLGSGDGSVKDDEDARAHDGSAFFQRPLDVAALVRKLDALTGGTRVRPEIHASTPPPSLAPRGLVAAGFGATPPSSDRPSAKGLPSRGVRSPGPPLPMSTRSLADYVAAPRSLATFGRVSPELQQLLDDAELRADAPPTSDAVPSPEEEIEAVLPADVLAALDEPVDRSEDYGTRAHEREHTQAKGTTAAAYRAATGSSAPGRPLESVVPTSADALTLLPNREATPPRDGVPEFPRGDATYESIHPDNITASPPPQKNEALRRRSNEESSRPPSSSWHAPVRPLERPSATLAPPVEITLSSARPVVLLNSEDACRYFADAIVRRVTGALCFESDGIVRRVALREGDLVAASSNDELESLVHFLAERGEVSREVAPRLAAKIPPYGRHAGAALVAHGWLQQQQLWEVLRAHAEWIASRILRLPHGSAQFEQDLPGRLQSEPSVFGAATGAAIFVDLVRRTVPWETALERLGGESTRIADGQNHRLIAECNLSSQELEHLRRSSGASIRDLLARTSDGEILVTVHALALLGVIEPVVAPDFGHHEDRRKLEAPRGEADEDAIRARVRARLELVEEGDYFEILGVSRDATGYEVRRAFLELRRSFEPSRILTARCADLADDVRKIVTVIEEAYEILRDNARRQRYRRAIEARPD